MPVCFYRLLLTSRIDTAFRVNIAKAIIEEKTAMRTRIFLGMPPASIEQWIKDHAGPSLNEPLCFTAEDAGATITFRKYGSPDAAQIVTSTNG